MATAMQHQQAAVRQRGINSSKASTSAAAAAVSQPCMQQQWIQQLQRQRQQPHVQRNVRRRHHICHASTAQRPLEVSSSIAAARAAESSRPDALFQDPFAEALAGISDQQQQQDGSCGGYQGVRLTEEAVMDVIATRYIDESLMNAMEATNLNSIQSGDYRQVVLLGDGMDTRPFRLLLPPGTLLFSVAPPEVHEQAEARLTAATTPAHVMRGCLLRRVNMNMKVAQTAAATAAAADCGGGNGGSNGGVGEQQQQQRASPSTVFREQLARAGFRSDRLSVWVVQGLHNQGFGAEVLRQLLAEVADCAAFHSLLVGELPGPLAQQDATNLLAEAGLLAAVYDYATADGGQYKRWQQHKHTQHAAAAEDGVEAESSSSSSDGSSDGVAPRWICTGQQLRLSLAQMGIYDEWSTEFEQADFGDDFIGNVS